MPLVILFSSFASFLSAVHVAPTWLEGLQRQSPLSSGLGAVVLHDSKAQEAHLLKVYSELKVFVPHGVEGVTVDGLGAEVAAVDGHTQNIHLEAGTAGAVAGTDVLPGNNLGGENQSETTVGDLNSTYADKQFSRAFKMSNFSFHLSREDTKKNHQ